MKIINVKTEISWLIECDGLSYVRYLNISKGEYHISWKRNFDWSADIDTKILPDDMLEKKFFEKEEEKHINNHHQTEEKS